jgi:DNA-binding IclR family transcriptional regulator
MQMNRGAISRVILAHLQSSKTLRIIESFAPEGAEEAISEQMSVLSTVRRNGYAIAFSEITPGATAVASAIFGEGAEPAGALCVTMRQEDCPADVQTLLTRRVPTAAGNITTSLREARPAGERHSKNPNPRGR